MRMMKFEAACGLTAKYGEHAQTPDERVMYCLLGLVGETGEVAEKLKKHLRTGGKLIDLAGDGRIGKELGDILWYLTRLTAELGFDMGTIMQLNMSKLADRQERGVLHGEGDER